MRLVLFLIFAAAFSLESVGAENSKYFVFVGEKISLERVLPKQGKMPFNHEYAAKYRVVAPFKGSHNGSIVEFTVFDHFGKPGFANFQHSLLYVEQHDGRYFHSKYQYSPVYKTKNGRWAGAYVESDYSHSFNQETKIKPELIDFIEPVVMNIPENFSYEPQAMLFVEPFYKIQGKTATAVYGNYIEQLFLLKQNGVLRARGDFQEEDFGETK